MRALIVAFALVMLCAGCSVEVTGHAVRGETPAEATVPDREREYLARLDLTNAVALHGRALALGWNSCHNIYLAGSSVDGQIVTVFNAGTIPTPERAAEIVFAAIEVLCPDGRAHIPR